MPKRRRLGDLYVTGKPLVINDDSGDEPVEIWIQKLSPVESETVLRRASVERAKFLAAMKDRESELWQSTWADLFEFAPTKEQLLPIALRDELARIRSRVEAEVSDRDEWKEEDYLQGLHDAWYGTGPTPEGGTDERDDAAGEPSTEGEREPLRFVYLRGEDDPRYEEAKRVFDEVKRWGDQVTKEFDAEQAALFKDWDHEPIEKLRDLAVEKMIEQVAGSRMLYEYETQELFYAVREPDNHAKRYFESRDEVLGLQEGVRSQLVDGYRSLVVETMEGKGLPGTPGSSPTSDSPEPVETSPSSGPVE